MPTDIVAANKQAMATGIKGSSSIFHPLSERRDLVDQCKNHGDPGLIIQAPKWRFGPKRRPLKVTFVTVREMRLAPMRWLDIGGIPRLPTPVARGMMWADVAAVIRRHGRLPTKLGNADRARDHYRRGDEDYDEPHRIRVAG
jgi:hypothetical protein